MEPCKLCEIWKEPAEGIFMNFNTYIFGDIMYAVWYQHETKEQMKLCKCKVDTMRKTLEIRARHVYGKGKFTLDYSEDGGHLHWIARKI